MTYFDFRTKRKTCKRCGDEKALQAFYVHKTTADGRQSICKKCYRDASNKRYAKRYKKPPEKGTDSTVNTEDAALRGLNAVEVELVVHCAKLQALMQYHIATRSKRSARIMKIPRPPSAMEFLEELPERMDHWDQAWECMILARGCIYSQARGWQLAQRTTKYDWSTHDLSDVWDAMPKEARSA